MADEDWGDVGVSANVEAVPVQIAAELPEVKLFGRWSCDDVEVSDMSLQVRQNTTNYYTITFISVFVKLTVYRYYLSIVFNCFIHFIFGLQLKFWGG